MVNVKSQRELDIMRRCGRAVAKILQSLSLQVRPGITLLELDEAAERMTLEAGGIPAFKGYRGFQHTLCTSVNEQVVHGIPSKRVLKDGDILGIDFGINLDGYYGDSAITVPVGPLSPSAKKLLWVTKKSLYAGISAAVDGAWLRDVSKAIESAIRPYGYGIVREFVGHGIGRKLHEDPQVPNYEAAASPLRLREGMTLALEPMVNEGTEAVRVLEDKWTAVTIDGKLSAHFEHTIAITKGEAEILTDWEKERFGYWTDEWKGDTIG